MGRGGGEEDGWRGRRRMVLEGLHIAVSAEVEGEGKFINTAEMWNTVCGAAPLLLSSALPHTTRASTPPLRPACIPSCACRNAGRRYNPALCSTRAIYPITIMHAYK